MQTNKISIYMKTSKTPLSIKVIYWITQIIFGLLLIVGGGVIVFNIMLFTDFFGNDLQLHVQFPVKVNILEEGNLFLSGQNIKIELVEGITKIHFFNTPMFLARWFGSAMLIAMGIIIYLIFTFRKFIINVKQHTIFVIDNIQYLKNIAYGLFTLWLFAIVYMRIIYSVIGSRVEFNYVEIIQDYPKFSGLLLLSLFIWVLSHIFMTGLRLQEEKDLTV